LCEESVLADQLVSAFDDEGFQWELHFCSSLAVF